MHGRSCEVSNVSPPACSHKEMVLKRRSVVSLWLKGKVCLFCATIMQLLRLDLSALASDFLDSVKLHLGIMVS